jgi:hypothetical protein
MAANEVEQTLLNQDAALDSYLSKLLDDIPSDAELDTEKESTQALSPLKERDKLYKFYHVLPNLKNKKDCLDNL